MYLPQSLPPPSTIKSLPSTSIPTSSSVVPTEASAQPLKEITPHPPPSTTAMIIVEESPEKDLSSKEAEDDVQMAELESGFATPEPVTTTLSPVSRGKNRKYQVGQDDIEDESDDEETESEDGEFEIRRNTPVKSHELVVVEEEEEERLEQSTKPTLQLDYEGTESSQRLTRSQHKKKKPKVDKVKGTASTGEKKLVVPLIITEAFLVENNFDDLLQLIKFQGWENLCSQPVVIDPDLIRAFYAKFKLLPGTEADGPVGHYNFEGESFTVTSTVIKRVLKVPAEGFCTLPSKGWTLDGRVAILQRLFGLVPPQRKEMTTHCLSLLGKMTHQFITRVVVPRQEKHTSLNINDAILLDLFLRKEKINLPRIILSHMGKSTVRTHSLPYAALIKELLKREDLYKAGEEIELGQELEMVNIQKMKHSAVPEEPIPTLTTDEGDSATVLQAINKLCGIAERILEVLLDIQGNLPSSKS